MSPTLAAKNEAAFPATQAQFVVSNAVSQQVNASH